MNLDKDKLDVLFFAAESAALKAGEVIRNWDRSQLVVMKKKGGLSSASQVVTEVDLRSQKVIAEILGPTSASFDLGFLTEESADTGDRFCKDYFWCIDPMDGTLSFIEDIPGYSVSIALVSKHGVPVIGVVYNPREDVLYSAVKGAGARRNRAPWTRAENSRAQSRKLTFFSDRSFTEHPVFEKTREKLNAAAISLGHDGIRVVVGRGAALNACGVLEDAPACYFKYPRPEPSGGSLWDFSASACIAAQWGAWVSDIKGAPLDLNRNDSTFMNHSGVLYASETQTAKLIQDIYKELSSDLKCCF